jgi:hypothetical protein
MLRTRDGGGTPPVLSEQRIHLIASSICAIVFFAFFEDLVTYTILNRSLISGDDAYFAMISKALAFSGVYGLPISSVQISPFDPLIGTGPAMILPGAILMRIFGPQFWVPGATAHLLFLAQMAGVFGIFSRQVGIARSLAFVTALIALMQVMSGQLWYLPSYLGEVPAFGYLALAAALLATGQGARRLAFAGVLFALAYLTKQIVLFAAVGVVATWSVFAFKNLGLTRFTRACAVLIAGGLALLVLLEVYKMMALGLSAYEGLFHRQVSAYVEFGLGHREIVEDRAARFLDIAVNGYLASWRTLIFMVVAAAVAVVFWVRSPDARPHLRFALFMWAASAVFLAYFLVVAQMYDRYLAIGVYALAAALAAPLLALNLRWSVLFGATMYLVMMFGIDLGHGFRSLPPTRLEQVEVVEAIAAHPQYPIAGRSWHSLFDVLYVLEPEREWVDASQIDRFKGRGFLFVALMAFAPSHDDFMNEVLLKCRQVPLRGERYQLRLCDESFWMGRN